MNQYSWANPKHSYLDAEKVASEIESIRLASGGVVSPSEIVDAARDESLEIHKAFDWDDESAARKHRIQTARGLTQSLRVTVLDVTIESVEEPLPKRLFASVRDYSQDKRGYVTIDEIFARQDWSAQVLRRARADLESWMSRYSELRERLPEVFESVAEARIGLQSESDKTLNRPKTEFLARSPTG